MSNFKEETIHTRKLAYIEDGDSVNADSFYHTLRPAATELSGIKNAIIRYDKTLKFFKEKTGE